MATPKAVEKQIVGPAKGIFERIKAWVLSVVAKADAWVSSASKKVLVLAGSAGIVTSSLLWYTGVLKVLSVATVLSKAAGKITALAVKVVVAVVTATMTTLQYAIPFLILAAAAYLIYRAIKK